MPTESTAMILYIVLTYPKLKSQLDVTEIKYSFSTTKPNRAMCVIKADMKRYKQRETAAIMFLSNNYLNQGIG